MGFGRRLLNPNRADVLSFSDEFLEVTRFHDPRTSSFIATASHDPRQPLQALSLPNGTMRRVVKDGPLAAALSQEEQAIGAMSHLLIALLDIGKLDRARFASSFVMHAPESLHCRTAALPRNLGPVTARHTCERLRTYCGANHA